MPGNLYGVSQPGAQAALATNPGDTACPTGTETNTLTSNTALVAPGQGNWFLLCWYTMVVLLGATAPGALTVAIRIAALADFDSQVLPAVQLVNNATVVLAGCFVSPASQANFFPTGSVINLTVLGTAQPTTFKGSGSRAMFCLFRGPDA